MEHLRGVGSELSGATAWSLASRHGASEPAHRSSVGQRGQPDETARSRGSVGVEGRLARLDRPLDALVRCVHVWCAGRVCVHARVTPPAQALFVCHPSTSGE